ncbi:hypothetical protein LCGC14_2258940, partial [marine sediment metagenome]
LTALAAVDINNWRSKIALKGDDWKLNHII